MISFSEAPGRSPKTLEIVEINYGNSISVNRWFTMFLNAKTLMGCY